MLLNKLQVVEIESNIFQLCMMVALEGSFVNLADRIVVQFKCSQIVEEMKAGVADCTQVIVAQIELSQGDEWSKCWHWKCSQRSGQSVRYFQ